MPNMDKTGPQGAGSKTGRGMGLCGGGLEKGVWGCGCGCGLGMRKGRRRLLSMAEEEKRELLQEEVKLLKEDLEEVEKELSILEK